MSEATGTNSPRRRPTGRDALDYSPSAKAGRFKLILILVAILAVSALIGTTTILNKPSEAYKPLVRLALTLVLCFGAYAGNKPSVMLLGVLLALAALYGVFFAYTSAPTASWELLGLIIIPISYGYCAFSLLTSTNIQQFWSEQRAMRKKA